MGMSRRDTSSFTVASTSLPLIPGKPRTKVIVYTSIPADLEPARAALTSAAAKELDSEVDLQIVKTPK